VGIFKRGIAVIPGAFLISALFSVFPMTTHSQSTESNPMAWPPGTKDNMPGTRWWWMGSAVNPEDLARELKAYREAGLGTVEITPIYGVKGREKDSIDYLSPKWMQMLETAVVEGRKLDMNVEMVTGTGWCFGGPNVDDKDANASAIYKDGKVSQKPSGVKVKRPAPGGEGWMLNLLYPDAMTRYLEKFGNAFSKYSGPKPYAQFHDSYEYDSDWAPDFFDQFEKRRGYKLQDELPALFEGKGEPDHVARVKGDYRETVSDLVTESVTRWAEWCRSQGSLSRNQAHGSPGNWLDLYAASDIPETEIDFFKGGEIPVSKFASSAAHVSGKKIVSSETGTWSAEHFAETLGQLKGICDEFLLAGVNRIMWHGTTYSPADAPWPGWCFYASTEMNPRNAIWHDAPALHAYLTRAQSLLQSGNPDNDVLVYWPIHDYWHNPQNPKKGLTEGMSVHGDWFEKQTIGKTADWLWDRGYAFDYVSDKLLVAAKVEAGGIRLGDGNYRAVVVPDCEHMPVETMQKIAALAGAGGTVVFQGRVPQDVPGLNKMEQRRSELGNLASKFTATPEEQLVAALAKAGVRREEGLAGQGLHFVRRAIGGDTLYFIVNSGKTAIDKTLKLSGSSPAMQAVLLDPMSGRSGMAELKEGGIRLQLEPDESVFVRLPREPLPATAASWIYFQPGGSSVELSGKWELKFVEGGPELPKAFSLDKPASWTGLGGPEVENFAGTAVYCIRFDAPVDSQARGWVLDLGKVVQSARVRLNGQDYGTVFTTPYRVQAGGLKPKDNVLEIEVTGTSANRIRDLDVRGVDWKIFHDANVLNRKYKKFDASDWKVSQQGLIGPVTLRSN
jgi:hypothetical protein